MNRVLVFFLSFLLAAPLQAVERVRYIHTDNLGSPAAATDEKGVLVWSEHYRPYGERMMDMTDDNHVWFTGKLEQPEIGLNYFGARWYDPMAGRFMGVDPVGVEAGNLHSFNRYAYANNNPYGYVDPDGRLPIIIPILFAVAAEGLNLALEIHYDAQNPCNDCVRSSGFLIPGPPVGKGLKYADDVSNIVTKETFQVGKSLGAASTRIPVRGASHLAEGTKISNIRKIADGRGIREVNRLVEQYGGKAKNWLKRSGDADVVTAAGNVRRAEVHWYEAHGVGKVEFKVKTWLD